ncbi:MAG TPA: TolC family protein [Gammaproteobacteria bacterium]|nr:TolC family protein [Gammaproteobacteria bacterium]
MLLTRIFPTLVGVCLLLPITGMAGGSTSQGRLASETSITIDSELSAFIQAVWRESPAIQEARAALDAARARTEGAGRPLHNPSLELDTERTDISTSSIGLSQTLDWSDKQGALEDIARREQQAAQANFHEVRRATTLETLEALVDFSTARETLSLAKHRTKLMQTLVDTARQRQAAGDLQALDVTLAQVAYSEALMAQVAAQNALVEAEVALQAVSGLKQPRWPLLPDVHLARVSDTDTAMFERLPSLVMLRSQMDAARARTRLAKKAGSIDPTLGVRAGKEDTENLFGLSLEIPLFVRNNFSSEARAASFEALAAEQAYRNAYRRAQARLSGAFQRFENTRQAWRSWRENGAPAQRKQMQLLDQLWQAGELSVTDYLIQAKQNIDTQEAAAQLLGETRRTQFAWLAAANLIEVWLGLAQDEIETNSGESK